MFHRVFASFLFFVASLSILAAATTTVSPPAPTVTPGAPANQCNGSNNLQCCNSLERSDGSLVGNLLGLLGVVIQGAEVLVGITCSPIDIAGIGQNSCHTSPVCCTNNNFSGIIAIGCVPININL